MSRLFDSYYKQYDSFMKVFGLDDNAAIINQVKQFAPDRRLSICDIGGGTGLLAHALIELGHEVTIIDPSTKLTEIAGRRNPGVIIINEPFETCANPSLRRGYDLIILRDCFHHIEDQALTLAQIYRSLKAGGSVMIQEFSPRSVSARMIFRFERCCREKVYPVLPERLAEMMTQAGFRHEMIAINRRDYILTGAKKINE